MTGEKARPLQCGLQFVHTKCQKPGAAPYAQTRLRRMGATGTVQCRLKPERAVPKIRPVCDRLLGGQRRERFVRTRCALWRLVDHRIRVVHAHPVRT
jgi:hypothetical protein